MPQMDAGSLRSQKNKEKIVEYVKNVDRTKVSTSEANREVLDNEYSSERVSTYLDDIAESHPRIETEISGGNKHLVYHQAISTAQQAEHPLVNALWTVTDYLDNMKERSTVLGSLYYYSIFTIIGNVLWSVLIVIMAHIAGFESVDYLASRVVLTVALATLCVLIITSYWKIAGRTDIRI